MNKLKSITTTTPDGDFHIIIDAAGIAKTSGYGSIEALSKRLPEDLQDIAIEPVANHPYETYIQAYCSGDTDALDNIPRDQNGSEFQKAIWRAISSIPYGKTISYKQLAIESGNPEAIRAAGTVCGLNRLILLVPCHRVIKSDGTVGNYLYGTKIKKSLLKRERINP